MGFGYSSTNSYGVDFYESANSVTPYSHFAFNPAPGAAAPVATAPAAAAPAQEQAALPTRVLISVNTQHMADTFNLEAVEKQINDTLRDQGVNFQVRLYTVEEPMF